ncbi:MAG: tRNA (adenosine(37)-N6)-threonylcarbamoyltransferase complex ATPase subunit type 1 TsaE [Chloroflexota bacterium]
MIESHSPEDTRALGERLAPALAAGDVLLLSGELGAGKTLFVQGLARGLGFSGPVSSKSFVIMGEYAGRVKLYHADLYRLDDPEQVQDLALDEMTSDGVLAVEWPERAGGVLPEEGLHLRFEVLDENTRRLHIEPLGTRADVLAEALRGGE